MERNLDKIFIRSLMACGILGINPSERENPQDICVDITVWADTRPAAASDLIEDAVNYSTISKAVVQHIESGRPRLVERLVAEIAELCCEIDHRIAAIEVHVAKPTASRYADSVGVSIYRTRAEMRKDDS